MRRPERSADFVGLDARACGLLQNQKTSRMTASVQRFISMGFLLVALTMFLAMNFMPLTRFDEDELGWEVWPEILQLIQHPLLLSHWSAAVGLFSFLMFSLLIVASPFLGNVWVKSFLAWSISVIFSGVAAAGFWAMVFKDNSGEGFILGGWCLMISPVFNFAGLLLARPQLRSKSGPSEILSSNR